MGFNNILFTHHGNEKGTIVPFGTGNDIITAFSSNNGTSFTQKNALNNGLANRFPGGVLYNPTGNTNIANAYTLVAGPIIPSTTGTANYYHSEKYDGTGQNHQEFTTDPTYHELIRNGLVSTDDGKFHISGIGTALNSAQTGYTGCKLFDMNGTWNSTNNKVDWGTKGQLSPDIVAAPSTGFIYIDGSYTSEAWSKDGSVGYRVMLGADNRPASKPSVTPIVWKSSDGGVTWVIMNYFEWGTLPAITDHIYPIRSNPAIFKPFFEEASMVVDGNNKPHIFGLCRGAASANLDSLNYIWTRASSGTIPDGNIIELYLDNSDVWQGLWIDSISADAVPPDKSPYLNSPENLGWNHRLSSAVSFDGSIVFCSWTDSDWIFWGTEPYNYNPDLKGFGRDIYQLGGPVENFTEMTDEWGLVFFHFMSPVPVGVSGGYDIPIVFTDIITTGFQASEPVYFYYYKDCHFDPTLNYYTVTTNSSPSTGGETTGWGSYPLGAFVTAEAHPNTGWNFINWTANGTIVSTSQTYTFNISGNRTLVAHFSANSYTISTSSNPDEGGITTGTGNYTTGSLCTVLATPFSGWSFLSWTEGGEVVSTSQTYSFQVMMDRTLDANFTQLQQCAILTSSNPPSGGNTSGSGNYVVGQSITLSAYPNQGWYFINWTENGSIVSTESVYNFTATANRTLTANFHLNNGIDEHQSLVRVFPNPTSGFVRVKSPQTINRVEVFNSMGIGVYNDALSQTECNINLSDQPGGIYFFRITIHDEVVTLKIVLL